MTEEELQERIEYLENRNDFLEQRVASLSSWKERATETMKMVLPEKIYTHKERRNTTVRFKDGSTVTVKRKQGEKDCIETAIAYCILKRIMPPCELRELIKEREEH